MAKADNNKESGAEKAPVLTEDKGADNKSVSVEVTKEITPEEIAELKATVEASEKLCVIQSEKIKMLLSDNEGLEAYNTELKAEIELKESIIKDKDNVIKELEDKIALFNTKASALGINAEVAGQRLANAVRVAGEHVSLVRFLLSPAGRFKLPYNVGQEVALHKEVAAEIVEAMYAEYVE
ncbi:MAG: hypothetical protein LBE34_13880 [Flavobacteriaceae bacterium]|jgi:superfamily I DNA and RNA helicase|nr:hypothetical protein [Flavobacteriaceae bacterium]